ncbi:MAG: 3-isopropylmalate dehydrogenase [Cyclobacteriaceae bacterium]|nr:MAG: 3-isopropylmalate dehydrogenase [Cyclobacteriaceae bacterium]
MNATIAVLAGDGIGPEVTEQAIKSLKSIERRFHHQFHLKHGLVGAAAIDATGNPFPDESRELCQNADAILFGAIGHPKYDNDPKAKVRPEQGLLAMRKQLGLFANVRPVKSYQQLLHISPLKSERVENVDFVVFRELTGGIYFGEPRGRSEDGSKAFDSCVYSKEEIIRVTELAFQAAAGRRKKVTLVDKANVLATSRLWRETVTDYAREFPEITLDCMFVDNAAMQLIQNPGRFDVILTENMFGDIITDEASVITGSLGMLPSASVGTDLSLFEPIHGSYPEVAGMNRANPMAAILSLAMMLEYSLSLNEEAQCIRDAVESCISEGILTEDLTDGKAYGTSEVGEAISEFVSASRPVNSKSPS